MNLSATQLSVAFAAGLVSIVSPCVWPLVPGYLSLVSGVPVGELEDRRARVVGAAAGFVAGFTVVFTLAGAGVGILGGQFLQHRRGLELIGGSIVIALGVLMVLPAGMRLFQREVRVPIRMGNGSALWTGLAGAAFAIGWTPCIGPTLGSILTIAGTEGRAADGALLLLVYSLGLAVPFLAAGIWLSSVLAATRPLRAHWALVTRVSGVVLIGVGLLVATGRLAEISARLGQ